MATFIVLGSWTREGLSGYAETVRRADAAREAMEKVGINFGPVYWTQGPYDVCFTMEAPDEETATAALLRLGSQGNLRTTTLRAFTRAEMTAIIDKAR